MHGPDIIANTLTRPGPQDRFGNIWQYLSRSDRHSKVSCWAILFDMLQHSQVLRRDVEEGRVVLGINQEMRDFRTNRKKDLDLVIADRGTSGTGGKRLDDLAKRWSVHLTPNQQSVLASLPDFHEGVTGTVRVALEAKATMTEHVKALPRLFDELNSSHFTVHANTDSAIAVGFSLINAGLNFYSPDRNKGPNFDLATAEMTIHKQPNATIRTIEKLRELPRRAGIRQDGFDSFGITVIDIVNDGVTPVRLVEGDPAPTTADVYHYSQMINRAVSRYETSFAHLR